MPPAERGRRVVERARAYEAEVGRLLTPAQEGRLRQIGLQAEGPAAFGEPEVVADLKLTPQQREQIRTIEEDALFGWMRGPWPNTPLGTQEKSANERHIAVPAKDQLPRWKAMTGEAVKVPIEPFGSPGAWMQP